MHAHAQKHGWKARLLVALCAPHDTSTNELFSDKFINSTITFPHHEQQPLGQERRLEIRGSVFASQPIQGSFSRFRNRRWCVFSLSRLWEVGFEKGRAPLNRYSIRNEYSRMSCRGIAEKNEKKEEWKEGREWREEWRVEERKSNRNRNRIEIEIEIEIEIKDR